MSAVKPHVPPCATLCRPVPPDWIPYILRFQILEAWICRPGAWMLAGLEWIGGRDGRDGGSGMDARREEGIGRTSHTLELQELGGYGLTWIHAHPDMCICNFDLFVSLVYSMPAAPR